jgi:haloalkane dehalogenase
MSQPGQQRATILGHEMAWIEAGSGDPIVFLHGNPTSSYLWRNIWPALADQGRCIVPDLIGMGASAKLPDSCGGRYDFATHSLFLDALFDQLQLADRVTLVVHDWGSGLGFDWARRHQDAVLGIAYMEAIVKPMSWDEWPEASHKIFAAMRSPAGEEMILEKNIFVERILPASIMRELNDADMAAYRQPFINPGEDRRPTLDWPRQMPLAGEPADVVERVQAYADWLAESPLPKLFINAEPGAILIGAQREFCRSWPNQSEITVQGIHFIQEDSPNEIAAAISRWYAAIS